MSQPHEELPHDGELVQQILDAASTGFATRGLEGTSLRRIAERAGVRHTLISYNYRDKETLWREAAAFLYGRLVRRLREVERQVSRHEPRGRVRRLLIEFVIACSESRIMTFAYEARGTPRNQWLRAHYAGPIRHFLCGVIEEGQKAGHLPAADPNLHYQLLAGTSIVRGWWTDVDEDRLSAEQLEREAAKLVDLLLVTDG